jgi:hypothetical protein
VNKLSKIGAVLVAYIAAFLIASAAMWLSMPHTQGPQVQASGDMSDIGDLFLSLYVFGIAALFPTGLALYFLRPARAFWAVLSIVCLTIAVTGLFAAIVIALASSQPSESFWGTLASIAVLPMLVAPLLALAFGLATSFAPARRWRWTLFGATLIEGVVAAYAFIHWFVPYHLF